MPMMLVFDPEIPDHFIKLSTLLANHPFTPTDIHVSAPILALHRLLVNRNLEYQDIHLRNRNGNPSQTDKWLKGHRTNDAHSSNKCNGYLRISQLH
jgi:hypothetical protein